jgi:hypothetical protein
MHPRNNTVLDCIKRQEGPYWYKVSRLGWGARYSLSLQRHLSHTLEISYNGFQIKKQLIKEPL